MTKTKHILVLLLLIIITAGFSFNGYKLRRTLKTPEASFFTTDNLGNIYTLCNNVLCKYTPNGDTANTFVDKTLGAVGFVDPFNPLKVLILYPAFAQIKILDRKLAPTTTIKLRDIGILQPTLICNSYNDCIWIYDQQDFQLKRIGPQLKILNQSGSIAQLTGKYNLKPTYLIAYNNWVYLVDPLEGIMQFDLYGTYYKTISAKNVSSIQVIDDMLLYLTYKNDTAIYKSYNTKNTEEKLILLPNVEGKIKDARIFQQNLFLLREELLDLYSF